jgi:hypothetical protein
MIDVRKRSTSAFLGVLLTIGITIGVAPPASATAQTCITAPNGYVCTMVYGSGTYVSTVGISRGKVPSAICNYSAWFFYIPPTGGAYGLGSNYRAGCTFGRAWLDIPVNRSFPRGTQVCAKFYENAWSSFIGQQCVGLS